ncbi:MAG: heme o synthase [Halobacteria archaeon]
MAAPSGPRLALEAVQERLAPSPLRDCLSLTKPRLTSLNLLAGVTGFLLASGPAVDFRAFCLLLAAGYLSVGGSLSLNAYLDRDIDPLMGRTALRPLPTGRMAPRRVLAFSLAVLGSGLLAAALLNTATLLFVAGGAAFYIGVYTLWLKRRTPWNIVIGGAAGSFAPLAGWAAATGGVGVPGLFLAALIFLWTPGHFWGLAIKYREDYARAGVPMLPVVAGEETAARWAALSNLALVPFTFAVAPLYGLPYAVAVGVLGLVFAFQNLRLLSDPSQGATVFHLSNLYLAGMFAVLLAVGLL